MTLQLATRNSDSTPLDFGTSINFDATQGMQARGRLDNAEYVGPWFPGLTSSLVTVSSVADNYALPSAPAPTGWSSTWVNKAPVPAKFFPTYVQAAGVSYGRIADDPAGAFIRDTFAQFDVIDPNDDYTAPDGRPGLFRWLINYCETTNAADGHPLLTPASSGPPAVTADQVKIAAGWPNIGAA